MKIQIKKTHPDAIIPKYAKLGDAGMDLTAVSKSQEYDIMTFGTGISIEIPDNYVGLVFPRSSIFRTDLLLSNGVGVIDSKFRGEIMFKFKINQINSGSFYNIGDRIGQLIIMPYPKIEFEEVEELPTTERGSLGYGSSGN